MTCACVALPWLLVLILCPAPSRGGGALHEPVGRQRDGGVPHPEHLVDESLVRQLSYERGDEVNLGK